MVTVSLWAWSSLAAARWWCFLSVANLIIAHSNRPPLLGRALELDGSLRTGELLSGFCWIWRQVGIESVMGLIQSQEQKGQLTKIERRMIQAMAERAQKANVTLKTFNTFILKFPKIDASFEAVREVFNKADKNGDGSLDMDELKQCLQELQVEYSDQEIEEFHHESDMDSSHGIQFKEFIVVLALIYLLGRPTHTGVKSAIGLPDLEATFDEIAEAFVFFDRNKDGYVSKKEMIWAINEASPSGRHGHRIGVQRFEEMDWDKDGMITFKEFLFAFTDWVGLENDEEETGHNNVSLTS